MQKIKPYFVHNDLRGNFYGISQNKNWKEINYTKSKQNATRGNHYHKSTIEGFYIISGEIEISLRNIKTNMKHKFIAKKDDIFIIEPYELHTFNVKKKSSWINMLSKAMNKKNKDFYTI